jgi:hypothetical protein
LVRVVISVNGAGGLRLVLDGAILVDFGGGRSLKTVTLSESGLSVRHVCGGV